jgi:hypothetical protein
MQKTSLISPLISTTVVLRTAKKSDLRVPGIKTEEMGLVGAFVLHPRSGRRSEATPRYSSHQRAEQGLHFLFDAVIKGLKEGPGAGDQNTRSGPRVRKSRVDPNTLLAHGRFHHGCAEQ